MRPFINHIINTFRGIMVAVLAKIPWISSRNPFNKVQYICVSCLACPQQEDDEHCVGCNEIAAVDWKKYVTVRKAKQAALLAKAQAKAASMPAPELPATQPGIIREPTRNLRTSHVQAAKKEKSMDMENLRKAAGLGGVSNFFRNLLPFAAAACTTIAIVGLYLYAPSVLAMGTKQEEVPSRKPVQDPGLDLNMPKPKPAEKPAKKVADKPKPPRENNSFNPSPKEAFEMKNGAKIKEVREYFQKYGKVDIMNVPAERPMRMLDGEDDFVMLGELIKLYETSGYDNIRTIYKKELEGMNRYQKWQQTQK